MAEETPVADPIIDDEVGVPQELKGKKKSDLVAYYQRREQILADQLDRASRTPAPKEDPKPKKEVAFDIFNDPEASVERKVADGVNAALTNAQAVIAPGIISGCKLKMANTYKDWSKFSAEVESLMATFSTESQMNPSHWESTYYLIKGRQSDKLVEEAVNSARNPIERPTPKGSEPPTPRALGDSEKTIAAKLGISADRYRTAADEQANGDNSLPFTFDSTKPKRKAS